MRRFLLLTALMGGLCAPTIAAAQISGLYDRGVEARLQGDFERALALLESASAIEPDNVDVLVQLGFTQLALGDLEAAESAFRKTLELTPDYQDARYGLAQVALRRGEREEASALVGEVLTADPANADAIALKASIEQQAVETGRRWRLDTGVEHSDLTAGRPSWTDIRTSLSYRLGEATTIGGSHRFAKRGAREDQQVEGFIAHRFTPQLAGRASVAVTPDADFLADLSLGGGLSFRLEQPDGPLDDVVLDIDVRHEVYSGGADVTTISPGAAIPLGDRLTVTARTLHALSQDGLTSLGYQLRADLELSERLIVFAGYSDAPEISEGTISDVQSAYVGGTFKLNDAFSLNAGYAKEWRAAYDRNTASVGLSVRF